MDARIGFSSGKECGLRILRELVSSENRADGVPVVAAEGGSDAGAALSLRVVCLDFNDAVGM